MDMSLLEPLKNVKKTKSKKPLLKKGVTIKKGDKEKKTSNNVVKRLSLVRRRYNLLNLSKLLKKKKLNKIFKNNKKIVLNFRERKLFLKNRKTLSLLLQKWINRVRGWRRIKKERTLARKVKKRIKRKEFIYNSKFSETQNLIKTKKGWYFSHRQYGRPLPPYKVKDFYVKSAAAYRNIKPASIGKNLKLVVSSGRFKSFRVKIMRSAWVYFRLLDLARKGRKRPKKIKTLPTISFYRTVSNLFYALRDRSGKIFHASSIGTFGLKGKKRYEPFGMRKVAEDMMARFKSLKIYKVHVICRSPIRKGIRSILWFFQKRGMKVERVVDLIRMPHGKVRFPARRRMKHRRR
jgi:ribosomal protein S11